MSSSPSLAGTNSTSEKEAQREKKIKGFNSKITDLESQIAADEAELRVLSQKLQNPNAQQTVNHHIKLLHDYNEIRDVGQGLMGLIAEGRGERVGVVQEEFGLGAKD